MDPKQVRNLQRGFNIPHGKTSDMKEIYAAYRAWATRQSLRMGYAIEAIWVL